MKLEALPELAVDQILALANVDPATSLLGPDGEVHR